MAKKSLQNTNHDSLPKLADSLVSGTKNLLREAKTEEDLRIGFEKLLEPIRFELNLKSTPKYEKSVYSGRSDAVHGQVIIEYEPPKSFTSKKNIDHAYGQLVNYLSDEAKETKLWLRMISDLYPGLSQEKQYLIGECEEIIRILASIVIKTQN